MNSSDDTGAREAAAERQHARRRAFVAGHPIAHSRSPMLHGHWLRAYRIDGIYERRDVTPSALPTFLANLRESGYVGGNVTVPHKTAAIPFLSRVDDAARAIGAVNTLWLEDGRLVGGNTDASGLLANLDEQVPGWDAAAGGAVVLGAGGAARAAIYGLLQRGFPVQVVNRTREHAEALCGHFGPSLTAHGWDALAKLLPHADILINTTSLGMVGEPPLRIELDGLKPSAVVHDIVYAPLLTELLRTAERRGHRAVDGLGMLLHQAVFGFERWFGVRPAVTQALRDLLAADIRAQTPDV